MQEKIQKEFFNSEIVASELVPLISLLRREYLSSAVNMLTSSPQILDIAGRDFYQLNCFNSDQETW